MKLYLILSLAAIEVLARPNNAFDERLINGEPATKGQFPYMVSLREFSQFFCGGFIVDKYHILTAAHCAYYGRIRDVQVDSLEIDADRAKFHQVKSQIIHPGFNDKLSENDIAILVLDTPIEFNSSIQPIPLETEFVDSGVPTVIPGWGLIREYPPQWTDGLLYFEVNTINITSCLRQRDVDSKQIVDERNICTLRPYYGGLCFGDSGSPLVANGKAIGIASWSMNPCGKGSPDVFTRISAYTEWIEEVIAATS